MTNSNFNDKELVLEMLEADRLQTTAMVANEVLHRFQGTFSQIRERAERLSSQLQFQQKDMAHGIIQDVEQLEKLLHFLHRLAQLELTPVKEFSLFEIVEEIILFFQYRMAASKIQMMNLVDPNILLRTAHVHLKQILMALITNAIESIEKSTSPSPMLIVHAQVLGKDVLINVEDNGGGLSEETKKNLFRPFESDKQGHVGLSLAVCKKICFTEGWEIKLKTSQKQSTQFEVLLPYSSLGSGS